MTDRSRITSIQTRFNSFHQEGVMEESEKPLRHANCGGNVRQTREHHYVCDRCHAEAEGMVSAAEKVEGEPEVVTLCNPHEESF
jgi:hypothetical protein